MKVIEFLKNLFANKRFRQALPIIFMALFIGLTWLFKIEWGLWGYPIVLVVFGFIVWYGFGGKLKK